MNPEIPYFYRDEDDDSRYEVDVIRDRREPENPHYDVDLVRYSLDARGLTVEQRLTLAEYDDLPDAEAHRMTVEDTLLKDGLDGLGEAREQIVASPVMYDGQFITAIYPPEEGQDLTAATLLQIGEDGIKSATVAKGERAAMEEIAQQIDASFVEEGPAHALEFAEQEAGHPLFGDVVPVHQVDGGGTTHWFTIVENDNPEQSSHELRYFRSLELKDGSTREDSYPVMPLPDDDPGSAWPLPGLEMYLAKGDIFMAQQFAHDVADAYGQDFPHPLDLDSLNPDPEYYFGYGISEDNSPALEAVKTWMDGAERRFDTLTLNTYGTFDEAAVDERELEQVRETEGLQAAMNLAESMAVSAGFLDPERDDLRMFFEDDAPPDPFTTQRQRELPQYGIGAISANGEHFIDVIKTWGEDEYERLIVPQPDWETARQHSETAFNLQENDDLQGAMHLIEGLAVDAGVLDPEREDPRLFQQGPPDAFRTLREIENSQTPSYSQIYKEAMDEADAKREANADLEGKAWFEATFDEGHLLEPIHDTVNYAVVMHETDPHTLEVAVEKYWNAENGYIGVAAQTVQEYAPDEVTQAEADRDSLLEVFDKAGLEDMMHTAELRAMRDGHTDPHRMDSRLFPDGPPDRFESMAQRMENEVNPYWNVEPESESPANPYWQMNTFPAQTPDGDALGYVMHMTVFPQLDADDVPEEMYDSDYPTQARTLEMAHFETREQADKFGDEFRGYLMPGVLEGPELAEEVARLEGHPVQWQALGMPEINHMMSGNKTVTLEPADWHPYNPNAERDARERAEGVNSDPIFDSVPNEDIGF